MKFRGHESFFIRKGWIYKGLKNVEIKPDLFTDKKEKPSLILGIGTNMTKSLRYWLQALNLTKENKSGKWSQEITQTGKIIFENDPYIEELGSLWILHYMLATNKELATSWYFFFNEFNLEEFKKQDFVEQLKKYINMKDPEANIAESSLANDFDVLINTYLNKKEILKKEFDPENNIESPLGELNLIGFENIKEKIYKKKKLRKDIINPYVILTNIIDVHKNEKEIKISTLLDKKNNPGKIFNMDIISLLDVLYSIQNMGFIKVVRTAGLDVIRIQKEITLHDVLNEYYANLDRN